MKLSTITTALLTGIASAAPAWEPPYSLEDCYRSGQWGKQEEGRQAIRDFCKKHGNGQIPPNGIRSPIGNSDQPWIQDVFSYNSRVEWSIKVQTKPTTSLGERLTYEECVICLYQAIDYCWGNNQDTRGGSGIVRPYRVVIDPNTKN